MADDREEVADDHKDLLDALLTILDPYLQEGEDPADGLVRLWNERLELRAACEVHERERRGLAARFEQQTKDAATVADMLIAARAALRPAAPAAEPTPQQPQGVSGLTMEGQAALDAARDEIDRLRRTIEENAHEMARVRRSAADSVEVVRGAHAESARLRGSVAGWLYVVEDALERDAAGQARALTLMRDQMRMALAGQQRLIAEARGLASAARAVVDRLRASRIGRYEDQFPGHGHLVPGIWDTSAPPALAGKPCEDCAAWNALRSLLSSTGKEESDGRP